MKDPLAVRFARGLNRAAQSLGQHGAEAGLDLAEMFGIGGFVRRGASAVSASAPPSPADLVRQLTARMLLDAAEEIAAALTALTVRHFFAKGVALLDSVYRLGDRGLVDIDLYVHPAAVSLTLGTLRDLGYRELPTEEQSGPASLRAGVVLVRDAALESVTVDVHWGIEPVDRLLPRADTPIPALMWEGLELGGAIPVPAAELHAALVAYHLVHHDLLHVRGLVDLAVLWRALPVHTGRALSAAARAFGVERALRAIGEVLVRDLGLQRLEGVRPAPQDWRGRRLTSSLVLHRWLAWAASADQRELVAITPRRVARRVLLLDDIRRIARLLQDAVIPPRAHLRWRWPETDSDVAAWRNHLQSIVSKVFRRE